jgi:hypothetical protein
MLIRLLKRIVGAPPEAAAPSGPDDFASGIDAFRRGDYGGAVAAFEAAQRAAPRDARIAYHLASALAAAGDLARAAPLAFAAHAAAPEDPDRVDCLRHVAVNLGLRGQALPRDPFWVAVARGNALLDQGEYALALAAFDRAAALDPAGAVAQDRRGAALVNLERFDQAHAALAAAAARGWRFNRMVDLRPTFLDQCATAGAWRAYPAGLAPAAGAARGRPTLLIGCDPDYFARYLPALVASLAPHAGDIGGVHVHLSGWDDACAALADRLTAGAAMRVEISRAGAWHLDAEPRVRHACSRFLLVPALLERAAAPVLVLDADLIATASLAPLLHTLAGADFAVPRAGRGHREPAEMLWASLVWFGPGPGGRRAAAVCAGYLAHMFAAGRARWFIDQFALLGAFADARATGADARLLDPGWIDPGDGGLAGVAGPRAVFVSATASVVALREAQAAARSRAS